MNLMNFHFTTGDIASVGTLFGIAVVLAKIIFGQGKAKQREEHFVDRVKELENQDTEFKGEIKTIKDDIGTIKVNHEKNFGELKFGISQLEVNILKEIKKINGGS